MDLNKWNNWNGFLTRSTLHGRPDVGETVLNFLTKLDDEEKDKKLRKELTQLKTLRDKLEKRQEILKKEINSDAKFPRLLSDINAEAKLKVEVHKEKDFGALIEEQKSEAYEHVFGIFISDRSQKDITFNFTSNINGTISNDIYKVTLSKIPKLTLTSAWIPGPTSIEPTFYNYVTIRKSRKFVDTRDKKQVIPMQKLADEFLPHIHHFVKEVKRFLDAYLSRFEQLYRLQTTFTDQEVFEISYSYDLTRIDFALCVGDQTDEDRVTIKIGLPFEHGQDRPRKGSVKVKFIEKGKELEEEDKEAVKTQCQFFHKFPIDVALKKAFLEAVEAEVEDEREDHEAVMDES